MSLHPEFLAAKTGTTALPNAPWLKPGAEILTPHYAPVYPIWTGWVRQGEDRDGDLHAKDPYSRKEALLLRHPALADATDATRHEALLLHLDAYLQGTLWLESDLVNVVNRDLARGRLLPFLPDAARLDALRIAGDEDGHSVFTEILRERFAALRRSAPLAVPSFGEAARALAADEARATPEHRALVRFFWTVAIETLITANLTTVTVDPTVNPLVRAVLKDHAIDEARHHAFFAQLFRLLFPNLTPAGRSAAHEVLATALGALIRPDLPWLAGAAATLELRDPVSVAHDLVDLPEVHTATRAAATPTLRLVASLADLADPAIRAPYRREGLVA